MKQKFHFVIVSFALLSLVFSGFGSVTPAFATAPIDQSNFFHGDFPIVISSGVGQGFTPLETDIVAIDIGLKDPCSGTWSVLIHNADIGGPVVDAPPISHSVNADLTQHITFPSITLTPETLYVIEIISTEFCSQLAGTADLYDRGDAFAGGGPLEGVDFVFATYHSFGLVVDSDGDGVLDDVDLCSGTPEGVEVDEFGCEIKDEDGDGVLDDVDDCKGTPEGVEVDEFGCEISSSTGKNKSCETLAKVNPAEAKGKAQGKDKAKEKNNCS